MASITVKPISEDVPFGARVFGVTREALKDQGTRDQIAQALKDHGVLIFEDIEQSGPMQVDLSNCFGPLKDHPVASVERVDQDIMPGVIVIKADPNGSVVEIDGEKLSAWQPWHFDHCYNNELNYAGVLRSLSDPGHKGRTGFVDGIQLYNDMPADLLAKIEGKEVIYTLDLVYSHMRYANRDFRLIQDGPHDILDIARAQPRAVHPAVWTRDTGEKVFHMAPWMAFGFLGDETPHGDQLFEEVWDAALKVMKPYFHEWKGTEMVVWDNSRVLHRGMGCAVGKERVMHRTTIKGDYGVGRWEDPNKTLGEIEAEAAAAVE